MTNRFTRLTLLSLALNAIAVVQPKLAVFGLLIAVIALAAGGRGLQASALRQNRTAGLTALAISVLALYLFAVREAVPGIAEARARDAEQRAVSRLRELLFAQDSMRKLAAIDPDRDRVGSAGLLSEVSGATPLRTGERMEFPPLESRLVPRVLTPNGPALRDGSYLFYICVPRASGGFTAQPGQAVDDERAERNWFAWAWPGDPSASRTSALAIDQDERIWKGKPGAPRFEGPTNPPPCERQLLENQKLFEAWRGKRPRAGLPHAR